MSEEVLSPAEEEKAAKELAEFVLERMRKGVRESTIVATLVQRGVAEQDAVQLVAQFRVEAERVSSAERHSAGALLPSLGVALAAALVGGLAWGYIQVFTGYEIGYVAWGVGVICGFAAVTGAGGGKSKGVQLIAAATSLLGIVIGKHVALAHYIREYLIEGGEYEAAEQFATASISAVMATVGAAPEMFGAFDLLWVILALSSAWKIAAPIGIDAPA